MVKHARSAAEYLLAQNKDFMLQLNAALCAMSSAIRIASADASRITVANHCTAPPIGTLGMRVDFERRPAQLPSLAPEMRICTVRMVSR